MLPLLSEVGTLEQGLRVEYTVVVQGPALMIHRIETLVIGVELHESQRLVTGQLLRPVLFSVGSRRLMLAGALYQPPQLAANP